MRAPISLLVALGLGACASPGEPEPLADDRPPNVVLLFTDDQGYGDLSSFGHPTIHTPHLDALAAGGAKLTQFYVGSPVCSPSRAALLTGCYPKRVGMHEHVIFPDYDYGLHTDEITIADLLGAQGYATGCFGKWHLGHRPGLMPTDQGFDVFYGVPYSNDMAQYHRKPGSNYDFRLPLLRGTEVIEWEPDQRELTKNATNEAVAFVDRHAGEPFFLYVPYSMPHIPIYASEDHAGTSPRGLYGDVIEEIDASVGSIVAALERNGLVEDTLIIFASDNGPWLSFKSEGGSAGLLRGGKGTNWEGGQRVPCIASWPGTIPAGRLVREVVTAMDILPTIAGLAGAPLPGSRMIDGRDVAPILFGAAAAESPTESFLYYTSNGDLAGIRRGPWKLLLKKGELYHVERDVSEQWDVAAEHAELVAELAALAHLRDREITDNARPVLTVEKRLFNPRRVDADGFTKLFNGKNLKGWVPVNVAPSTFTAVDGMLHCSGKPTGELRTDRMYQNFILEIEWRHNVPAGNAGIFVWADDITARGVPFHRSVEVQVLDHGYGNTQSHTTHGDIFPIHGARMTPINGRGGSRAFPTENHSNPSPEWNHYRITCNDGAITLAVNGVEVTKGVEASPRYGYICLESEGGIVDYRNIRIQELPDTAVDPEDVAIKNRGYRTLYTGIDLAGWDVPPAAEAAWEARDWVLAHPGEEGEAEHALTTSDSFDDFGFVVDVRRPREGVGGITLHPRGWVGTLEYNPGASDEIAETSWLRDTAWHRLEGTMVGDLMTVSLDGKPLLEGIEMTGIPESGPLRIVPHGPVELANLFIREL